MNMVTKYHQTKSGINAGKWVICKATKSCRNSGNDTHVSKEELAEISKMRTKIGHITLQEVKDYRTFTQNVSHKNDLENVSTKTIKKNGVEEWRLPNGKLHKEDGPAYSSPDGSKEWRINGYLHRVDGPAKIDSDGSEYWYQNRKKHRVDGPAIITAEYQLWYYNDELHRYDGPAIVRSDGVEKWYQNGIKIKR